MAEVHQGADKPPPEPDDLMDACREGREEDVREILSQPGIQDLKWRPWGKSRWTALMHAAQAGHLGVVQLLVEGESEGELQALLDIEVCKRDTLCHFELSSVSVLGPGGKLVQVCKKCSRSFLLGRWVAFCQTEDEKTALFFACEAGHEDVVDFLVDRKASLGPQGVDEMDMLMVASAAGHVGVGPTTPEKSTGPVRPRSV